MLSELASSVHRTLVLIGTIYLIFTIAIVTILCIAIVFLARMSVKFIQLLGWHEVVCPETGSVAIIRIHALQAAVSSTVADPELHVRDCSRWPQRHGCSQECVLRNRA